MDNSLLLETLKFYAKSDNYNEQHGKRPILNDGGNLARFTLDNYNKMNNFDDKLKVLVKELENATTEEQKQIVIDKMNNLNSIVSV